MSDDTTQKRSLSDRLRPGGGSPLTPGRRRLLVRLGMIVLAVAALVVAPAYMASRPRFMQRYENMAVPYSTWSKSVHAKFTCQQCHVDPALPAQAAYSTRMLGEFYLSIVSPSRQPNLLPAPTNRACARCHIDLRTVSPTGDIKIPHRAHVTALKMKCVTCHDYLVHEKNPEGTHRPRMAGCLKCHDGRTAKSACSACHTDKGFPVSHRAADWVVVHPLKQKQINCIKCHKWAVDWCAKCHTKRPRSHGADWRSVHRLKVKTHRNCETCHEAPFCIRCHGERPSLNFNPAVKLVR